MSQMGPADLRLVAGALLFGVLPVGSVAQTPDRPIDEPSFQSFRAYQEARPWLRLLQFTQYPLGVTNLPPITADGAIQPGGYYLRYWTNSPATSNLIIWGLSADYEWEYAQEWRNVCYSPRHFWTNAAGSLNYNHYEDLELVARLGLPRTFPDGFQWRDEAAFSFQGPFGLYTGIVTEGTSDRPIRLVCALYDDKQVHWRRYSIDYHYSPDITFPPAAFEITLRTRAGLMRWRTDLQRLATGVDPDYGSGYPLRSLVSQDVVFRNIYFMSNRVRYVLLPDGTTAPYKYSTLIEDSAQPVRNSILLAFVAIIVTGGALMTRWRRTLNRGD